MSRVKKGKVGAPTLLTNELILQIKECVLQGMNIAETARKIGISEDSIYSWKFRNTEGLADKLNTWNTERQLQQAEKFSDELLAMNTKNADGTINTRLAAIKQKESEFLREKLLIARDKYNSGNVVNVNVALPQPIIDLSKVVSTVDKPKELDK